MYALCLTKMGWATFWATFFQTHLVPTADPILRFLNSQLQRQHCGRLERFLKVEENIFVLKTH
jgi:hypothetical protein